MPQLNFSFRVLVIQNGVGGSHYLLAMLATDMHRQLFAGGCASHSGLVEWARVAADN